MGRGNDYVPAYFEKASWTRINGPDKYWVYFDNKYSICIKLEHLDIKEIG